MRFLQAETITAEMRRLAVPVEKTAGPAEMRAFAFLDEYIRDSLESQSVVSAETEVQLLQPRPRAVRKRMSRRAVLVTTGSRLHFGLFAFGQPGRGNSAASAQ